jgi:hypothetical protein
MSCLDLTNYWFNKARQIGARDFPEGKYETDKFINSIALPSLISCVGQLMLYRDVIKFEYRKLFIACLRNTGLMPPTDAIDLHEIAEKAFMACADRIRHDRNLLLQAHDYETVNYEIVYKCFVPIIRCAYSTDKAIGLSRPVPTM